MLDKKTLLLLNIINDACDNGGYKIFEISELISLFPSGENIDADTLREGVRALSAHGYLSVKYEDENEFCLMPLPSGRAKTELDKNERESTKIRNRYQFFYSFLGALIGGIGTLIIALLIFWRWFRC